MPTTLAHWWPGRETRLPTFTDRGASNNTGVRARPSLNNSSSRHMQKYSRSSHISRVGTTADGCSLTVRHPGCIRSGCMTRRSRILTQSEAGAVSGSRALACCLQQTPAGAGGRLPNDTHLRRTSVATLQSHHIHAGRHRRRSDHSSVGWVGRLAEALAPSNTGVTREGFRITVSVCLLVSTPPPTWPSVSLSGEFSLNVALRKTRSARPRNTCQACWPPPRASWLGRH